MLLAEKTRPACRGFHTVETDFRLRVMSGHLSAITRNPTYLRRAIGCGSWKIGNSGLRIGDLRCPGVVQGPSTLPISSGLIWWGQKQ